MKLKRMIKNQYEIRKYVLGKKMRINPYCGLIKILKNTDFQKKKLATLLNKFFNAITSLNYGGKYLVMQKLYYDSFTETTYYGG